ncbi:MAG: type II toxin-antitoxin system VapC family toxin [Micromonosporaceae bacterium]
MTRQRAIADTSVLIGVEAGRITGELLTEYEWAVSSITFGELELGVVRAADPESTARRLATLRLAQLFDPLPVDERVASAWALMVARLREAGRKAPINDTWIAATAVSHGVPLITQDTDYQQMPGLTVITV